MDNSTPCGQRDLGGDKGNESGQAGFTQSSNREHRQGPPANRKRDNRTTARETADPRNRKRSVQDTP
ncbi:hypothetical protein Aglo01_25000 [Actinokineospora globicatena]|nr:hypothetical protein Aglo01_25000 [Actinokineospora globicatena]GLW85316.1 hypothetical protein Aglo02_29560 [Actinokineospora globicatena]